MDGESGGFLKAPISIDAAADLLGASRRMVERRISDGSIRVLNLGRAVRIPVSELHCLLDGNGEDHRSKIAPVFWSTRNYGGTPIPNDNVYHRGR